MSTFYVSTSINDMTAIRSFWTAIKDFLPNGTTVTTPNAGDEIAESDGRITGVWTGTGGGTSTSIGAAGSYSGATGAVCEFQSNAIVNGRRPLGKIYVVPIRSPLFDNTGSLDTTNLITPLTTAANTLLAAYTDGIKVWSRPYTPPTDGKPHPPARVGSFGTAISVRVPDLAVTLRSRRI